MSSTAAQQTTVPPSAPATAAAPAAAGVGRIAAYVRSRLHLPPPTGRPALVLLTGLPGTGKSYLAAQVVAQRAVAIVRSDQVRKILFPRPTYSGEESGTVFLTCYELLRHLLAGGWPVLFDATNLSARSRQRAAEIAKALGAPLLVVQTVAPPQVVRERLAARQAGALPRFSSDASWEIYERMLPTAEPVQRPYLAVDTSGDVEPAVAEIVRFLDAAGPGPVSRGQPG